MCILIYDIKKIFILLSISYRYKKTVIYILLPAYNEAKNLVRIFKKIEKLPNVKKNFTVVLVDDYSSDRTSDLLKKKYKFNYYYLRHKKNKGLSLTMETGFKKILKISNKDDLIVTLDSDNTHPISIIPKMVKKIKKDNDIVIASRFVKGSIVNGVTIYRKALSFGAKILFKFMHPYKNLNDYTCNFRIYKSMLIKEICKNKKFFMNEEFNIAAKIIIFLIYRFKFLKLSEIPFKLSYDYKIGESKIRLTKTIILTLRLILNKVNK